MTQFSLLVKRWRGFSQSEMIPRSESLNQGGDVPSQLILTFDGVTTKEYEAVNSELGIDMNTGKGNWPEGLLVHAAGIREDGQFVVTGGIVKTCGLTRADDHAAT